MVRRFWLARVLARARLRKFAPTAAPGPYRKASPQHRARDQLAADARQRATNVGRVLGRVIFETIVMRKAPRLRKVSRYSGSAVHRPIPTDTAMRKELSMKPQALQDLKCRHLEKDSSAIVTFAKRA